MNLKDLFQEILVEADIEDLDLIQVTSFMWFPIRAPSAPTPDNPTGAPPPTVFRCLHSNPMPTDGPQVVLCQFHKGGEMNVYVVPVLSSEDPKTPPHLRTIATGASPPLRYTLSKNAPTMSVESIALPLFRDEIVKEMRAAVGINDDDDDDTVTCTNEACKSEESAMHVFCSECGTKLPEEITEEVPAPAPANAPPPAAVAPPAAS